MNRNPFVLDRVHSSWQPGIIHALTQMDNDYLENLYATQSWLPGPSNIFNAFSLPLNQVNYVLFGESPYPRADSANGFAFWDARVKNLWSATGMDKNVNRATSLRNFIKMLLVAEGFLQPPHITQTDIAALDKSQLVQTNGQLFQSLISHGFLLLNASLVLQKGQVRQDAKAWLPFLRRVINYLLEHKPHVCFLLFGNIAHLIEALLPSQHVNKLRAEHPYNHSFITNPEVLDFFRPLHLLFNQAQVKVNTVASKDESYARTSC